MSLRYQYVGNKVEGTYECCQQSGVPNNCLGICQIEIGYGRRHVDLPGLGACENHIHAISQCLGGKMD